MPSANCQLLVYNDCMRIALGADHGGFELKEKIRQHLADRGIAVEDLGTHSTDSVDYPDYARAVGEAVTAQRSDRGILVCGSGIGMSIAANKIPGIRAVNGHNEVEAQLSREHNDSNVLTLGGRTLDNGIAIKIVDRWLNTEFPREGRHLQRLKKINEIERDRNHNTSLK
jgi:ribose 5-phosphate isomerase B